MSATSLVTGGSLAAPDAWGGRGRAESDLVRPLNERDTLYTWAARSFAHRKSPLRTSIATAPLFFSAAEKPRRTTLPPDVAESRTLLFANRG